MNRVRKSGECSRAEWKLLLPALALCLAALGGCAVGPDFAPPQTDSPKAWSGPTSAPASQPSTQPTSRPTSQPAPAENLARWWNAFHDPTLTSLVERAMAANLDLRLAESRIRQARANRGMAAAGLGPTLDVGTSYQRSQAGGGGTSPVTSQYQAGFDAGWEIDIFGGVRRGVEAATAEVQSAIESRRDVQVTLAAEVARNYIELRSYQQRILIARRNLQTQQHSEQITRQKFAAGMVTRLDIVNAQAQVATTLAQIPLLESAAQQSIYALSVLMDRAPGALLAELSPTGEIPFAPPTVPAGVPADLLRRRPDIRGAEADIHTATANIGVATADLYPKATINGSLGWQNDNGGTLFDPVSRFWSFGPSVTWNAFQSGKTLSNIEVQKALTEQSILTYRQKVLTAFQEVENALIASAKEQEHRASLADAVTATQKSVELSQKLYEEGNIDFLDVLTAQKTLLTSEDSLAQSTAAISTDLVALYKALGGGWEYTAGSR